MIATINRLAHAAFTVWGKACAAADVSTPLELAARLEAAHAVGAVRLGLQRLDCVVNGVTMQGCERTSAWLRLEGLGQPGRPHILQRYMWASADAYVGAVAHRTNWAIS